MIGKDQKTKIETLNDLNTALLKLSPSITGIDSSMFQMPATTLAMMNAVIKADTTVLRDGITRAEILNKLKPALLIQINTRPASAYTYDTHGDKHFPGGSDGSKFTKDKSTVNPKLVAFITPVLGRIRRDAKGKNQSYYLTNAGIPECGGKHLTIQVDFNYANDSIMYHGYPDASVTVYSLSRAKGGTAIPT